MEKAVTRTVEIRTDIFLTVEEIEEILREQTGLKYAAIEWNEFSCGGIRGVTVSNTTRSYETL